MKVAGSRTALVFFSDAIGSPFAALPPEKNFALNGFGNSPEIRTGPSGHERVLSVGSASSRNLPRSEILR